MGVQSSEGSGRLRWEAGDDVLTSVLRSLRLQGVLFCRAELEAPWGIAFEPQPHAHFHVMEAGQAWLRLRGERAVQPVGQGDLVLIPHGGGHALVDPPGTRPVPLHSLVKPVPPGHAINVLKVGAGGDPTRLVCGAFRFGAFQRHPLLAALPPAIVVRASVERPAPWLAAAIGMMSEEARRDQPGAAAVVSRLTDVIFLQAVRAWMESQPGADSGWVGALRDPQVGRALALVHRQPERQWSVAELGAEVGLSRSPFSARFASLVGEGPLSFLRRWRLHLAADLLVREPLSVAEVALEVGYGSEAALSKAFRREWGVSPTAYRRRAPAPGTFDARPEPDAGGSLNEKAHLGQR